MGFWSSVGSAISSAVSFVSNAVSSIGGALAGAASGLLKVAGPLLGDVTTVIQLVAKFFNVLKPSDNVEELGAKAMQADKKPEDFDSNAEYIDYLRNEIELDKEKFNKAGPVERSARTAVGASIASKGIEEAKGINIPAEFWVKVTEQSLKTNEISSIIQAFKDNKLEDYVAFSKGELSPKDEIKTGDKLAEIYKDLDPSLTDEEIEDKIMKMEATA
ncbi:MAG: Unknown protein [uncultured Thiotrichaceae bacterium]|uniref:Uncharacterized protein n=1 Tax=uncultured Thiotrichaceae bacterium TaxID=298394 RepID=A0A6S6THR8_9GAMM|nr:MAG: Unknown protein [uncultured Thiotrichaceae bacterium]